MGAVLGALFGGTGGGGVLTGAAIGWLIMWALTLRRELARLSVRVEGLEATLAAADRVAAAQTTATATVAADSQAQRVVVVVVDPAPTGPAAEGAPLAQEPATPVSEPAPRAPPARPAAAARPPLSRPIGAAQARLDADGAERTSSAQPWLQSPAPVEPIDVLRGWLFRGNTIVKVGVALLCIGLALLASYASQFITVPIELRLAAVGTVAIALLALATFALQEIAAAHRNFTECGNHRLAKPRPLFIELRDQRGGWQRTRARLLGLCEQAIRRLALLLRQSLLWAVLVLSVGALGFIVWRLARSASAPPP